MEQLTDLVTQAVGLIILKIISTAKTPFLCCQIYGNIPCIINEERNCVILLHVYYVMNVEFLQFVFCFVWVVLKPVSQNEAHIISFILS